MSTVTPRSHPSIGRATARGVAMRIAVMLPAGPRDSGPRPMTTCDAVLPIVAVAGAAAPSSRARRVTITTRTSCFRGRSSRLEWSVIVGPKGHFWIGMLQYFLVGPPVVRRVQELSPQIRALQLALKRRYEIRREVGHGGAATVFLAHDLRHDRPVALKV